MNEILKDIDEQVWTWGDDDDSEYLCHAVKNITFRQSLELIKKNIMYVGDSYSSKRFIIHKSGKRISFKEAGRILKLLQL